MTLWAWYRVRGDGLVEEETLIQHSDDTYSFVFGNGGKREEFDVLRRWLAADVKRYCNEPIGEGVVEDLYRIGLYFHDVGKALIRFQSAPHSFPGHELFSAFILAEAGFEAGISAHELLVLVYPVAKHHYTAHSISAIANKVRSFRAPEKLSPETLGFVDEFSSRLSDKLLTEKGRRILEAMRKSVESRVSEGINPEYVVSLFEQLGIIERKVASVGRSYECMLEGVPFGTLKGLAGLLNEADGFAAHKNRQPRRRDG